VISVQEAKEILDSALASMGMPTVDEIIAVSEEVESKEERGPEPEVSDDELDEILPSIDSDFIGDGE